MDTTRAKEVADRWNNRELEQARKNVRKAEELIGAKERDIVLLRGAIRAQDERERNAGDRCDVVYHLHGCDWPEAAADEILSLRARLRDAIEDKAAVLAMAQARAVLLTEELDRHKAEIRRLQLLPPQAIEVCVTEGQETALWWADAVVAMPKSMDDPD